jgi:hypothetical protein
MTDERKQAEDKERALRVLLDRLNAPEFIDARDEFSESYLCIATIMESYAALKVAEAIKEMYPKAFLNWFTSEHSPVAILYGEQAERFASNERDYTIDELFEYWKQNIRK